MDELLRCLNEGGVRYLLMGGQAMRLAGMPRYSMDWDFFIPPNDLENLGQGGMGEVHRSTDTKLDREVEIKMLLNRLAQRERWNLRQVVECGNGACGVTAFVLNSAHVDQTRPMDKSDEKAVNRFARHHSPRRWRANVRSLLQ